MLEHIRDILQGHIGAAGSGADRERDELQRAVAALLVEAAQLDGQFGAAERDRIATLLTQRFSLSADAVAKLIVTATRMTEQAVDDFTFTRQISRRLNHEEKIGIVEMLWDVAYADGTLHPYEGNLLRRVAGLLYVTDQESGAARRRVVDRYRAKRNRDDGR